MDTQTNPPENTASESGAEETIIQEESAASPAAITSPESETSNEAAEDVLMAAPAEIIEEPVTPSPAEAAESAPSAAPEQSVKNESPAIELAPEIITEATPTPSPVLPEEKIEINPVPPPPLPEAPAPTITLKPEPEIKVETDIRPPSAPSETEGGFLARVKNKLKEISPAGVNARRMAREENLGTILNSFSLGQEFANDDVQDLLGLSDSTAQRYLKELIRQGKIVRFNKGKYSFYRKL